MAQLQLSWVSPYRKNISHSQKPYIHACEDGSGTGKGCKRPEDLSTFSAGANKQNMTSFKKKKHALQAVEVPRRLLHAAGMPTVPDYDLKART